MTDSSIISADLVLLDVDAGTDKDSVIGRLAGQLAESSRATDSDSLVTAIMAREAQSATGLPGGIAIPHCRSPHVNTASIAFARLSPKGYEEISRAHLLEPTNADASGMRRDKGKVIWSHPAFADKCCFMRNDKELIAVSLEK